MKRVNYKSLKSVDEFLGNRFVVYLPLGKGVPGPSFFKEYEDKRKPEKILEKVFQANANWKNYKYKKVDFLGKEAPNYLESFFQNKGAPIKKQVTDYINILATDRDDVYFMANLFAYIYNANNFQSKENKGQIATLAERKKLLDFPLRLLKMHKSNEAFKLSVLYQMYLPYDYQHVLFNETSILCDLYNTDAFQHSKRNQKDFEFLRQKFLEKTANSR